MDLPNFNKLDRLTAGTVLGQGQSHQKHLPWDMSCLPTQNFWCLKEVSMCGCLWMSNVSSEFSAGDPPKPPGPLFFPLCNSEPIAKTFGPTAPGAPGAGAPGGAPKPLGALAAPGDRQGSWLILKNLQVRNFKLSASSQSFHHFRRNLICKNGNWKGSLVAKGEDAWLCECIWELLCFRNLQALAVQTSHPLQEKGTVIWNKRIT